MVILLNLNITIFILFYKKPPQRALHRSKIAEQTVELSKTSLCIGQHTTSGLTVARCLIIQPTHNDSILITYRR